MSTDTRRESSHSGEHDRVEVAIDSMVDVRDTKNAPANFVVHESSLTLAIT